MNEPYRPSPGHNEDQRLCVQRYEAMLAQKDQQFFDIEELEMIIDHYLERNEPRQAERVLVLAKQLHPTALDITFCEAVVMMALGRLSRALKLLDAVEKVEPWNEEVQLHKAGIFSQQRNHRRSVEHYKRALELAEEGHRFFDLVRWGIAAEVLNKYLEKEKLKRLYKQTASFTAGKNEYFPLVFVKL